MQETWVGFLGQEDPLEKEMATQSRILAWEIPWTEESGRLQSMTSRRVGHDWACTHMHTACILQLDSFNWEREILVQLRSSDFILTCVGQKGEKMVSRFLGWSYCPPPICCVWFLGYREGLPFNILGLQCKSSSASSFPCLFWGEVTLTPPPSSLFSEHSIDDVAQINSPLSSCCPHPSASSALTTPLFVEWINELAGEVLLESEVSETDISGVGCQIYFVC